MNMIIIALAISPGTYYTISETTSFPHQSQRTSLEEKCKTTINRDISQGKEYKTNTTAQIAELRRRRSMRCSSTYMLRQTTVYPHNHIDFTDGSKKEASTPFKFPNIKNTEPSTKNIQDVNTINTSGIDRVTNNTLNRQYPISKHTSRNTIWIIVTIIAMTCLIIISLA